MTANRRFTEEEMVKLSLNPYVAPVTPYTVHYTVEFKKHLLEQKQQGRNTKEIFIEAGFDPKLLGARRINAVPARFKEEAESEHGLREIGEKAKQLKAEQKEREQRLETQVKEMQKKVEHLEAQLSFLKRMALLEKASLPSASGQSGKLNNEPTDDCQ